jgi:hypothetical protein
VVYTFADPCGGVIGAGNHLRYGLAGQCHYRATGIGRRHLLPARYAVK